MLFTKDQVHVVRTATDIVFTLTCEEGVSQGIITPDGKFTLIAHDGVEFRGKVCRAIPHNSHILYEFCADSWYHPENHPYLGGLTTHPVAGANAIGTIFNRGGVSFAV